MTTKMNHRLGRCISSTLAVAILVSSAAALGSAGTFAASPEPSSSAGVSTGGAGLSSLFIRDETKGDAEFGLTEAEIVRRIDATEAIIARCMADAGFEYFPVPYAAARQAMDSNSKPGGMSKADFRIQFGYGITTLLDGPASQTTMSIGDRNIAYKEGLSTADRVAYDRTLYGENTQDTFIVALDKEDFSQIGGCTRAAVPQIFSPQEIGASFVNYQDETAARVDADPRVIAAYKDWSSCLHDAGYVYDGPESIRADLVAKLDAITGSAAIGSLSAEAKTALASLQGEEMAISVIDSECEAKYLADIKLAVEAEILGAANAP